MRDLLSPGPSPSAGANRLRASTGAAPFRVVLVEPEIPPNTGNIGRLCAATSCPLHLVEPLGFRIDEHAVRRAGLDYWPLVRLQTHANFDAAREALCQAGSKRHWFFSGKASRSYLDVSFEPGDSLVFGKESSGLPEKLLLDNEPRTLGIPTLGQVRSLNLANSVAIALYEALRQVGALDGATLAP